MLLGAVAAFLALSGVSAWLEHKQGRAGAGGRLALLVAVGIGLHNLGEGLVIGTAYSTGALALGAFLVVGFALHNATEGLAIVAPIAHERPRARRLVLLGAAGRRARRAPARGSAPRRRTRASRPSCSASAPARSSRSSPSSSPSMRDGHGRALHPAAVGGVLGGMAVMFATGLLVAA